jgi:hypothetical protein
MQISTPWYIPVLMVLGILSLLGSAVCLTLHFLTSDEYDQLIYLTGFFVFVITAFSTLGLSKISLLVSGMNQHRN